MWITERVRAREKKKTTINDIEFQYVRSMIHFIKETVIKH